MALPVSRRTPSDAAAFAVERSHIRCSSRCQNKPSPLINSFRSCRLPHILRSLLSSVSLRRTSLAASQPRPSRSMCCSSSQTRPTDASSCRSIPSAKSGYTLTVGASDAVRMGQRSVGGRVGEATSQDGLPGKKGFDRPWISEGRRLRASGRYCLLRCSSRFCAARRAGEYSPCCLSNPCS